MGSALRRRKRRGRAGRPEDGMAVAEIGAGHLSERAAAPPRAAGRVRAWLYGLAVLVALMVAVGGATRLTGSGLSITEWRPVTGAIPPLSADAWNAEFSKYRASSQGRNLNDGMGLAEFKFIYGWEWGHRQLGRLLALAFFAPLVFFWWTGALTTRMAAALLGIGALGAVQGAIGWIMVASGLEPGMVAVAPVKLTLHLLVASVILSLIVFVAAGLSPSGPPEAGRGQVVTPGLRLAGRVLLGLVFVQIALGGLVAGSKAGLTYNTWPLMDGQVVPDAGTLFVRQPWLANIVDSPALVQFQHRLAGYVLVLAALWHMVAARRSLPGSGAARRATGLGVAALAQAALGITTLLLAVPLWAGLAHQLLAMGLLAMATAHVARSGAEARTARAASAHPDVSHPYAARVH